MAGLLHGFGEGKAAIGGHGESAGAQAVGRKFTGIESGHLRALLNDPVDSTWFQRPGGNMVVEKSEPVYQMNIFRLDGN